MRRDDALPRVATFSIAAFLMLAGPSLPIAAADPGGSHGNGGNSNSGKSGSGQSSAARGNSGTGGGSAGNGNSGPKSSASGQTNTGNSSKSNGNGNGNGGWNNFAPGAQANSGSDGPVAVVPTPVNPPVPVVVAEQHTGTAPAGRSWWSAPNVAPPVVEVPAPAAPSEEGAADLLSVDHTGIPVWAAAEPVGVRGDLFGLAGLVLMPLIGLAVGYRQAKAARDVGLPIRP
ncbi:hypothetical protein ACNO8X_13515 [Mycobacterium sp. PDNC021]|uniref:hypothetical protein n=1 Tax=Mycobacterium sp. PDNC021 TaxID=3391399 RepID=UPI003AAB410D